MLDLDREMKRSAKREGLRIPTVRLPAWCIASHMHGGRRRDGDGSAIGLRYRHMTAEMQARVLAVIDRCLQAAAQTVLRLPE